jgi:hypothetical protein
MSNNTPDNSELAVAGETGGSPTDQLTPDFPTNDELLSSCDSHSERQQHKPLYFRFIALWQLD